MAKDPKPGDKVKIKNPKHEDAGKTGRVEEWESRVPKEHGDEMVVKIGKHYTIVRPEDLSE